jgi:hypothetical protein
VKKYAFFEKVRIREEMAWQFRQKIVDAPLSCFHKRNHKSNSKEKASFRFLHASYTFCMTSQLFSGGWYRRGRWAMPPQNKL